MKRASNLADNMDVKRCRTKDRVTGEWRLLTEEEQTQLLRDRETCLGCVDMDGKEYFLLRGDRGDTKTAESARVKLMFLDGRGTFWTFAKRVVILELFKRPKYFARYLQQREQLITLRKWRAEHPEVVAKWKARNEARKQS